LTYVFFVVLLLTLTDAVCIGLQGTGHVPDLEREYIKIDIEIQIRFAGSLGKRLLRSCDCASIRFRVCFRDAISSSPSQAAVLTDHHAE